MSRSRTTATTVTTPDHSELVANLGMDARTIGCWQGWVGLTPCCSAQAEREVRTKRRFSDSEGTLHFLTGATKLFASGLTGGVYSLR
jgi:hypothetical protein